MRPLIPIYSRILEAAQHPPVQITGHPLIDWAGLVGRCVIALFILNRVRESMYMDWLETYGVAFEGLLSLAAVRVSAFNAHKLTKHSESCTLLIST